MHCCGFELRHGLRRKWDAPAPSLARFAFQQLIDEIEAQQASDMAGTRPGSIPSVFATSNGDGAVVHTILEALAAHQPVSPTQFHNSVHNAAAGYWSIATGSQQPTTCIAGHDATAGCALLKAVAEVQAEAKVIVDAALGA